MTKALAFLLREILTSTNSPGYYKPLGDAGYKDK